MLSKRWATQFFVACCATIAVCAGSDVEISMQLPKPGEPEIRVLAPDLLELSLVTQKHKPDDDLGQWDFATAKGKAKLPDLSALKITANNRTIQAAEVGFKRRVLYARFKTRDLRILNNLYLRVEEPFKEGDTIRVTNPGAKYWPASIRFETTFAATRLSPAIHVNQTGYMATHTKRAMVGYYLGSMGELDLASGKQSLNSNLTFSLVHIPSGKAVLDAALIRRRDVGFSFPCYEHVYEADFTQVREPGLYRLFVPGLGTSLPFLIDNSVAGAFARTYALGLYHQRCGAGNTLPFSRFDHGPCHTSPAEVPTMDRKFAAANESLAKESANFKDDPRHTAPQLKSINASLYPFRVSGTVDVSGGHHDAGDYSKYTINSASFIHSLLFAADAFPGAVHLDNLGLPESGDGKSDLLQEVKWEADFLCKMADQDGGFFFLVYPREREYEDDVLPDKGDPQVVFPKTTSATAAAVAALAQCASSPRFKAQFPESAARCLQQARQGWDFLMQAIQKHGKEGAYQKITHYGDDQIHDDELAWAACEMYLATKDPAIHAKVQQWLNPNDPAMRKWGWWRLFDAHGAGIRSYAFARRTGRVESQHLKPLLLEQCELELISAAEDQAKWAESSAYGTSFPTETKKARTAGWYFSGDAAFDLAVAAQLDYPEKRDPRARFLNAIISNLNYEQGCNPVNISFLTGLGWKRQHEIVHQFAQNDLRDLPPTGIPLGNIQGGFGWLYTYEGELDAITFPPDGSETAPYPIYDRWGDAFNLSQEFVILNQAKSLGYLAWLMAQTPLKNQSWRPIPGIIQKQDDSGGIVVRLSASGLDLSQASVLWEAGGKWTFLGGPSIKVPAQLRGNWIEAEALLPDGRRIAARAGGLLGRTP